MPTRFYLFFLLLLSFSCKKESLDPTTTVIDYFPVAVGDWVEYKLSFVEIKMRDAFDTTEFIVRETVSEMLDSSDSHIDYRIIQTVRLLPDDVALQDTAFLVTILPNGYVMQKNNIPELVLPKNAQLSSAWDRYAYTSSKDSCWYRVVDEFATDSIGNQVFDSLLVVEKDYAENLISIDTHVEKYAPKIGLVYSHRVVVNADDIEVNVPVLDRASSGLIVTKTYLRHQKK